MPSEAIVRIPEKTRQGKKSVVVQPQKDPREIAPPVYTSGQTVLWARSPRVCIREVMAQLSIRILWSKEMANTTAPKRLISWTQIA